MSIIKGNNKDNKLIGESDVFGAVNEMYGYGGNDTLEGGFFADNYIWGGTGDDILLGGTRINRLYGEDGNDILKARWSGSDSQLYGGTGNDQLYAADGGTYLDGGRGADFMQGGSGADVFIVDNVKDFVEETWVKQYDNQTNPVDIVRASVSYSLVSSARVELLETTNASSTKTINLTGSSVGQAIRGNAGANMLDGKSGSDSLYGNGGDDILIGGTGADKLYGGTGKDTFVFASVKDSVAKTMDTVYDFTRSQGDKIDLSKIDARSGTAADDSFLFVGEKAFAKKAGELRYVNKDGDTFVYGDINGDGNADFALRIDKDIDLIKGDFLL